MTERRNQLKLLKKAEIKDGIVDTPTPRALRVRRLKTIEDASKLIARITAELQKGNISIDRAKAIGFLSQVFISSLRQSVEEKTFDEILKTKFMLLQKDTVRILDFYIKKLREKYGLDVKELQKIESAFQQEIRMDEREWKKFVNKIKEEISTQTNFKMKILAEENPKEIKELIAFRLRQLPEDEGINLINEIIIENGWNNT